MIKIPIEIGWCIIATMGGIAKHLHNYLLGREFSWSRLLARILVSGFSGYMAGSLIAHINPDYANIAAGLFGYLGSEGLDILFIMFKKTVKLPIK